MPTARNPTHLTDDEFLNDWPVKSCTGQTAGQRTALRAFLTPDMREWLDTRPRTMLTFDLVIQFVKRFELEAREAGRILAQWVKSL